MVFANPGRKRPFNIYEIVRQGKSYRKVFCTSVKDGTGVQKAIRKRCKDSIKRFVVVDMRLKPKGSLWQTEYDNRTYPIRKSLVARIIEPPKVNRPTISVLTLEKPKVEKPTLRLVA